MGDLVGITVGIGGMRSAIVRLAVGRGYRDLRSLELRVIQELRGLGGSLLLECDASVFGVALAGRDFDFSNLAAIEMGLATISTSQNIAKVRFITYQKLKKSLTSLSSASALMFFTRTVRFAAMVLV